jgi:hypothetical protein
VTSKTVTVSVVGDTRVEPNETFCVNLSQPVGVTIVDGQGLGAILNDDSDRAKNWSPSGLSGADGLVAGTALKLVAGAAQPFRTTGFFLAADSVLDLSDNELIVDYMAQGPTW